VETALFVGPGANGIVLVGTKPREQTGASRMGKISFTKIQESNKA